MPKKNYSRADRIAPLIHRAVANVLIAHPEKPYFLDITITSVKISSDLSQAKIFFTTLSKDKPEEVTKGLNQEIKFIRFLATKQLDLRYVPQLYFVYDSSIEYGQKIFALIDKAISQDNK